MARLPVGSYAAIEPDATVKEASMLEALAVMSPTVSTVALLVALCLTVLMVSLASRATRPSERRKHTDA